MQKSQCLGCKTYFEEGQILPPQSLTIEYKNFPVPIRQAKHKWILLKTIVAFLNTKGGTIYIGVQDTDGKVCGFALNRKQKDDFKLYLKALVEKIVPSVDLMEVQQITVDFVPITIKQKFNGKYVTKIIVKQGNPGKLYCFSQRVILHAEKKDKQQEYEIVYTYRRHNMGGCEQAKGMKLVECAQKKAAKPNSVAQTFHEDCNPQPLTLEMQITKIGFGGLSHKRIAQKLEKMFEGQMKRFKVEYMLTYDVDQKVLILQLENKKDFEAVNSFIKSNIEYLNQQQQDIQFVNQGVVLDYELYQNVKSAKNTVIKKENKDEKKEDKKNEKKEDKKEEKKEEKKQVGKYNSIADPNVSESENTQAEKPSCEGKNLFYSLTFTHINPDSRVRKDLLNYLETLGQNKINFVSRIYDNTIELCFKEKKKLQQFFSLCQKKYNELNAFGFNEKTLWGYSTGQLHIMNYDAKKKNQALNFLRNLIGNDAKNFEFKKQGNKYYIQVQMKQKQNAAKWLDILLKSKQLKYFSINGAQRGNAPKMKVVLHCLGMKE